MQTLYLDFETKDQFLKDSGSGYFHDEDFRVLGMAYAIDDQEPQWTTDYDEMVDIIDNSLILIAHNAVYELGCIYWLTQKTGRDIDWKFKPVFCTSIGSKLENNLRQSHSLENLGKEILQRSKNQSKLGKLVLEHEYPDGSKIIKFPKKFYETEDKEYKQKTYLKCLKKATSWAMENLDWVLDKEPHMVEDYAKSDVDICRDLHREWLRRLDKGLYSEFSNLSKVTEAMRRQGVRVDLEKAVAADKDLANRLVVLEEEAKEKGWWCNYSSNRQLGELLTSLGICLPKTDKGSPKTDKKTLGSITHPIGRFILEYRKLLKTKNDFIGMILNKNINGRIHGTMNILGASSTGRFSHKNPNVGQIPSRDKELGPLLRGMFIADEPPEGVLEEDEWGWKHLDFSSQEPRLYLHFGVVCHNARPVYKEQVFDRKKRCWGFKKESVVFHCPQAIAAKALVEEDPTRSFHDINIQLIKEITGNTYTKPEVKEVGLGQAYGKGLKSTASDLGISEEEARTLFNAFNQGSPFIKMVSDYAQWLFIPTKDNPRNYIKTILGRKNHYDGVGYRAYNYLIQGSATDQTARCLTVMYYTTELIPVTVVHDEINFIGTMAQAKQVKEIMETSIKLNVPSYTEIGSGWSWGDAK